MSEFVQKPSELLELGIINLKECEKDANYVINMCSWHIYIPSEAKCHVCLAGAYLAKTIKMPFTRTVAPHELKQPVQDKAYALTNFSRGTMEYGLKALGYEQNHYGYYRIPSYSENPKTFYKAMDFLITDLFQRGY